MIFLICTYIEFVQEVCTTCIRDAFAEVFLLATTYPNPVKRDSSKDITYILSVHSADMYLLTDSLMAGETDQLKYFGKKINKK